MASGAIEDLKSLGEVVRVLDGKVSSNTGLITEVKGALEAHVTREESKLDRYHEEAKESSRRGDKSVVALTSEVNRTTTAVTILTARIDELVVGPYGIVAGLKEDIQRLEDTQVKQDTDMRGLAKKVWKTAMAMAGVGAAIASGVFSVDKWMGG